MCSSGTQTDHFLLGCKEKNKEIKKQLTTVEAKDVARLTSAGQTKNYKHGGG